MAWFVDFWLSHFRFGLLVAGIVAATADGSSEHVLVWLFDLFIVLWG